MVLVKINKDNIKTTVFGQKVCIDKTQGKAFPGLVVIPITGDTEPEKRSDVDELLGEAIKNGNVIVRENQQISVGRLMLEMPKPGYVLGIRGTILEGGGQDRQILNSFVIKQGTANVEVQCVQKGRWNPSEEKVFKCAENMTSSSIRFNITDQDDTWSSIAQYERMSETANETDSFTCTQSIILGNDTAAADTMNQNRIQSNEKLNFIRIKAQNMLCKLNETLPEQIGIMAVQIDPFLWSESGKIQLNCLMEMANNSDLWKKLHFKVIASLVYDAAVIERKTLEPPPVSSTLVQTFFYYLANAKWIEKSPLGIEKISILRAEHDKAFGETILDDSGTFVHGMASVPVMALN